MRRDAVFSKSLRPKGAGTPPSALNPAAPAPSVSAAVPNTAENQYLHLKKIKIRSDWVAVFFVGRSDQFVGGGAVFERI